MNVLIFIRIDHEVSLMKDSFYAARILSCVTGFGSVDIKCFTVQLL